MTSNATKQHRLAENDINAIFSSITNNVQPPERLQFKIIRIPPAGLKLAPPQLELDCGIYVLLRSSKDCQAQIPSNLTDTFITDSDLARIIPSKWILSGPQFQKGQASLQLRYCYPRGTGDYSEDKGGAMWSLVSNGVESIDTRILHVYISPRRVGITGKVVTKSTSRDSESSLKGTYQSKRKCQVQEGENNNIKKSKTDATETTDVTKCPISDVTKSPASFELDSSLNINSDNLFNMEGSSSINRSFTFMPVKSEEMNDNMIWNSPAFSSAVSRPPPKVAQQPAYTGATGYYPASGYYGYYYGYYGSWARPAPLVPLLTSKASSLDQNANGDEKAESARMSVQGFASKLKSMEEALFADIDQCESCDQAEKLQLLRQWAKDIGQKPLQPSKTGKPCMKFK